MRTSKLNSSDAIQFPSCLGACVEPLSRIRFKTLIPLQRALANKPDKNSLNCAKHFRANVLVKVSPEATANAQNKWSAPIRL